MPYKSQAQERWAHTEAGMKALGGPEKVAEWDAATKGAKLPERTPAPPQGKRRPATRPAVGAHWLSR